MTVTQKGQVIVFESHIFKSSFEDNPGGRLNS
jgi:hypothetical protein